MYPTIKMAPGFDAQDQTELTQLLSTYAPEELTHRLEEQFLEYLNAKEVDYLYAISATHEFAALQLALKGLDIKRGEKVICSVNTHPFVAAAIRSFSADPLFVDIDTDNFCLSLEQYRDLFEAADSKKIRAVIISHVGGHVVDITPFCTLARERGVFVLEDATQAIGHPSFQNHQRPKADVSIFRFSPHLTPYTCPAAILITADQGLAERLQAFHYYTLAPVSVNKDYPDYLYDVTESTGRHDLPPLLAASAIVSLNHMEKSCKHRKELVHLYDQHLRDISGTTLPEIHNGNHAFTAYTIKIHKNRDHFAREFKSRGIQTGLDYVPLHLLTYYRSKYELKVAQFPAALNSYQQILSLPLHEQLSHEQVMWIIEQAHAIDTLRRES